MDATGQAFRRLRIESALLHHAAEGRLDVGGRAAEPVVHVEMPERGIEVIAPHQVHDPASEPDALRITGSPVQGLGGFGEFIDSPPIVPIGLRGGGLSPGGRRLLRLSILGRSRKGRARKQDQAGERVGQT